MEKLLYQFYIEKNYNRKDISKILKISKSKVDRLLKKYNIVKSKNSIQTKRVESIKRTYSQNDIISKRKSTCLKRYGVESYSQTIEYRKKYKKTCLEKYGVESPSKNLLIRKKLSESNIKARATGIPQEKYKKTCLEKYGVESTSKLPEVINKMKNTCLRKYGFEASTKSKKVLDKQYQTKKKNKTLLNNTSREEEKVYQLLLTKFDKEDIVRQYRSKVYPFKCDFYIRSLDLYIEYQGSRFHQKEPFDKENLKHIEKLSRLKKKEHSPVVQKIIRVWTIRDPLKREVAKNNNIKLIEIFGIKKIKQKLDLFLSS